MSGEFIAALDSTSFKTALIRDEQAYVCACSLSIGVGVDKLDSNVSILRHPALLKAAHQRHHDKHFVTPATLYTITGVDILAAQCSCDYEKEHPDAR